MTNLPFIGTFKVTCVYKKKGNWAAGFHTGIDVVGNNKTVYSVSDGKVIMAKYYGDYGNCVKVKDNEGNVFLYAHLSSFLCKVGDTVSRASKIGIMGSTGNSTGPHLHIEMRTSSDTYGVVKDIAQYMTIPNQLGTYDSKDYAIDNSYKVGDYVETNIPVGIAAEEGDMRLVDSKLTYQYWVHKSVIVNNHIVARALIREVKGNGLYRISIFDKGKPEYSEFDCLQKDITKKL